MGLQQQVYKLIDEDNKADLKINDKIGSFIMGLIVLSIIAVVIESEESIRINYQGVFLWFEVVAVAIFTVEYLARVYTATLAYPELSRGRALIKYIFSPMAIVDLLAIAPFYIELIASQMGLLEIMDLRFIRVLRLMRLLRIFKLNRYSSSMKMIGEVITEEKEKLFITVFMTSILMVLAAALVWTVEHEGQPEMFPNIYASMWWAVATLTTVGYGDVYPVTAMGKILAGVIALLGIGLVALPTGILSGSFVQAINDEKEQQLQEQAAEIAANVAEEVILEHEEDFFHSAICPHCGKDVNSH
jgi:voltage-gated potassium channel